MNFHSKRFYALTATEMLLSLAIVGVIACLTLPGLIRNYKFKIYESSIKKFYAATKQAVTLYMAHSVVTDLRATKLYGTNYKNNLSSNNALEAISDFSKNYFHVAEVCDNSRYKCFGTSYKTYDGQNMSPDFETSTRSDTKQDYRLMDGSTMRIGFSSGGPIEIFVDTNGPKSPNRAGYDLWAMNIYYDGSIDEVFIESNFNKTANQANTEKQEKINQLFEQECKNGSFRGCFGKLVQNGFNLNISD